MSDNSTVKVKIGIAFAAREIELGIDDVDGFVAEFEAAMADDSTLVWWVIDSDGRRRGLVVDKVSYVDIEPERDRTIGFG